MENVDRCFRVDALHSNAHNATCAVKMLLIQALRVGAVAAKSWSELKAQTLGRADKTVQWTTPDHPVIPALIGHNAFLDLAKPANVQQPLRNKLEVTATKQYLPPKPELPTWGKRPVRSQTVCELLQEQLSSLVYK